MLASSVTESIDAAAAARNTTSTQRTPGAVGSQSPTAAPKVAFSIGKNSAFPWGTVQVRVTAPTNVAAKKHTFRVWPCAHCAAVLPLTGRVAAGTEGRQCPH